MTGRPGKWPWKNHSVAVTALMPDDPLLGRLVLDDPVHEEERPAVRDERPRSPMSRTGRRSTASRRRGGGACRWWRRSLRAPAGIGVSVPRRRRRAARGCVQGCTAGRPGGGHARCSAARNAALPTRSSRLVVNRPSRNGSEPSSARWICDVGDDALDDELAERGAAAGDRRLAGRAPRRRACRAGCRRTAGPRSPGRRGCRTGRPGRPAR